MESDFEPIVFRVDGQRMELDFQNVTSDIELDLYRESGLTLADLARGIASESASLFHVAALVFLARRTGGHNESFRDIAARVSLRTVVEIDDSGSDDAGPFGQG